MFYLGIDQHRKQLTVALRHGRAVFPSDELAGSWRRRKCNGFDSYPCTEVVCGSLRWGKPAGHVGGDS